MIRQLLLFAVFSTSAFAGEPLVRIEMVPVNYRDNPADSTGWGAVGYEFQIGKYEVTIAQYCTFLNAVAKADPHSLYNLKMAADPNVAGILRSGESGGYIYEILGSPNRPISYISWFDAARFCNWLHNGAIAGVDTENGAYSLNGVHNGIIPVNADASWRLPTENEWYKAAYYHPAAEGGDGDGYWLYASRSNAPPTNTGGTEPNQANYMAHLADAATVELDATVNYLRDVGSYAASASFFGTFDQTGNVWEFIDEVLEDKRGLRGGGWSNSLKYQPATLRHGPFPPAAELPEVGFRVAAPAELP